VVKQSPRLLSDVRVLDLADESGAFCAALLCDLGAGMVTQGDLDSELDVVVLTGRSSDLAQRGLDPRALAERFPQLIVAVISPFGLTGPRAEWRSCDTVAQALGGMLFVNGQADEPPLRSLGPQAYHCAGLQAAIGVVLALLARRRSGRGQIVDVSVLESTVGALEHVSSLFRERGVVSARQGSLHWTRAFRVAMCRDGPVLLALMGDWTALVEWLKSDGAADDLCDPRWNDSELRRAESAHVFAVLDAWAARYSVAELVEQAQLRRLPFASVLALGDVVQHPQLWARGFFARDDHGVSIVRPLARAFGEEPAANTGRGGHLAEVPAAAHSAVPLPPGGPAGRQPARRPVLPSPNAARRVLDGIRVLDFTWVVAGPVATRVLADHGADVIKIERFDSPPSGDRRGGWFGNLNRGKRSLAVDLSDERGLALMRELAQRCDVVIDNFSPRVMRNWGLTPAALHALNPRLVIASLSGFGASGPCADSVSYGPTLQAQTGFTWHMRQPGSAPTGWGFSYSDMASGTCAALAVLAALVERDATGRGRAIDLAQLELLASMIGPLLDQALRGESIPDALGNRTGAAPGGVYRCRDDAGGRERWCAIGVFTDAEWRRFTGAIGAPAWAAESRFADVGGRRTHADALDALVGEWTCGQSAETVMEVLQSVGIAAGVVADARDLAADPQLAARGYWVTLPDGPTLDGVVVRLSDSPGSVTRPGALLGEHSHEVLRDLLRMEQSAIDRLRADGVIY
jgi:crotonobetainyl-CoA:carnitine CoA-transferase CaiB-like acyl-CoA transferase